ncbi:MAG: DUF222 domain-containing protein, partial [Jatrophihabitans sp.]|uniref:HNH endonuclease signature motif containing protein n=1 Tax=Jatrophihabitans sp. TaxID=1932789 RepID=UPI003910A0ED
MSAVLEHTTGAPVAVATAHSTVDDLLAGDLTLLSEDELLEVVRETERLRRRIAAVQHAQILELERRGVPAAHLVRTTGQFLRMLLRLDPSEAASRVRAAEAAGQRRSLTGEVLRPAYPTLAAAQAAGLVSERHARVVVDTVEKLPDQVRWEHAAQVEADLVGYAGQFDPVLLARVARRISDHLDPDGKYKDVDYRLRTRDLTLHVRPDGSSRGVFEATAELTERLLVTFDSLAAPKPAADGVKDPRTAGQRRHDALLDAITILQRADALPTAAGVRATIVVTMTEDAYRTGRGLAATGHGAQIPADEALQWAGGDLRLLAVVTDKIKGITAYSSSHRLHTEQQRLAMEARDRGCTFPHCPAPPGQCHIHHLKDYDGTNTTVDNGALVCGHDHREQVRQGWTAQLLNGRIAWIPPRWIDPRRRHLATTSSTTPACSMSDPNLLKKLSDTSEVII